MMKKRYSIDQLKWPLAVLIFIEMVTILCWTSTESRLYANKGFLVKHGQTFIVFWIDDERNQRTAVLNNLQSAVEFARNQLRLEVSVPSASRYPLESLWTRQNSNGYAVYWKTFDSHFVNRLTFSRLEEASTFERFLKMGAYSPSPIGHSLALLPIN